MKNKIELNPRQLKPGMIVQINESVFIVTKINRIGNTSYCSSMINEEGDLVKEFLLIGDNIELINESYKDIKKLDKQEKNNRDTIVNVLGIECGFQRHNDKFKKKLAELIMNVKDLYTKDKEES
tara:strand:+ start:126 stop:497 length:372 start_codon:yes stop_codon:yes gene_type:complete